MTLARSSDLPRAVANFRFFATALLHAHSELHLGDAAAIPVDAGPRQCGQSFALRLTPATIKTNGTHANL